MRTLRRLLLLAAACHVVAAGSAGAQTLMLRSAPSGARVEVRLNAAEAGAATTDAEGHATVVLAPGVSRDEISANLFVDSCDALVRVLIVERGVPAAAPGAGCTRQAIAGVFVVRPVSTLVITIQSPRPRLLLRQGAFDPDAPPRVWEQSPTGFMVFGGGGFSRFSNAGVEACGNVAGCSADRSGLGYTAGVAYWFKPFFGVEGAFIRPVEATAEGGAETYRFTSGLDARVVTVAGLFGIPSGPVRVYAKAGASTARALLTTTQTVDERTIAVGDETVTIPGATQTLQVRTGGWGWQFGGGVEFWPTRFVALYGEAGFIKLKGSDLDEGEGVLDDRLTTLMVGVRVRLGR